ncbi:MAG TPA: hypothetical protein VII71_05710 [Verrucomicrobiae bacterium]
MIALCDNVQNVVMPIPTFFIPSRLNGRQFSGLPLSKDLSLAIKKIGLKSLGDLNGISQKDFQSVSSKSPALMVELNEIKVENRVEMSVSETQNFRQFLFQGKIQTH